MKFVLNKYLESIFLLHWWFLYVWQVVNHSLEIYSQVKGQERQILKTFFIEPVEAALGDTKGTGM